MAARTRPALTIEGVLKDSSGAHQRWERVTGVFVNYPDEGRFEVRGRVSQGRYRLRVASPGQPRIEPIDFAAGATDVVIELAARGCLRANVRTDMRLFDDSLELSLRPTGDQLGRRPESSVALDKARTLELMGRATCPGPSNTTTVFEWRSLRPGAYDLAVYARGGERPLLTIRDVRVTAGPRTRDPRLDQIDLRERLRAVRIRVVGQHGEPLDRSMGVRIMLDDPTPDAVLAAFDPRDGVATIFTDKPAVNLLIVARGYRPRRTPAVTTETTTTETTVWLEPYPQITLRLAHGLPALPAGSRLRLFVLPKERPDRDRRRFRTPYASGRLEALLQPSSGMQTVAGDGSARFAVRGKGRYRVYAFLQRRGSRRPWPVKGILPAEIEVTIGMMPGVSDVRLSQRALASTLNEMKVKATRR